MYMMQVLVVFYIMLMLKLSLQTYVLATSILAES